MYRGRTFHGRVGVASADLSPHQRKEDVLIDPTAAAPQTMALYGKVEYWDERYHATSSGAYDWYQNYASLRHLLTVEALMATTKLDSMTPFPSHDQCRVLVLGCGSSTFGEDMLRDGWRGPIANVDFSSVVIEQMKMRYGSDYCDGLQFPKMEFVCADITEGLPFPDKSFDLIICKGTLDAILCSTGSVANAKTVVAECSRVLANGHGVLFLVSYGNPDNRVVFLEHGGDLSFFWQEVSIHTVGRQTQKERKKDYVYICRKRMEEVQRPRRKLLPTNSNEENIGSSNAAPNQSKGEATVVS